MLFISQVYLSSGRNLSWLTVLIFIVYMVIQMIIMLNFLISILGDTFDKAKDAEEAELLSGCAEFIDACEASLSQAQCDEIKYTVLLSFERFIRFAARK